MKQNRTLIGVVAVLALVAIGVILLTRSEPQPPATAPTGATVAVPPDPAADQPAEPAQATATSEPAPAEAPAEAPAPSQTQAQAPETQAPETQAPEAQAPETQVAATPAPETQGAATPAPETPAAETPASAPAQVAVTPKAAEVEAAAEAAPESRPAAPPVPLPVIAFPPSFDVVRVERSGEAVIAGRAAPGSEVTLRAGNRILGKVTANGRGQWVLVLETPLGPGSYELSLESRLPGGEMLLSENVVVVSVPWPQVAAAQPEAPKQPEVAAQPEAMAPEAPAPEQQAAEQPAPEQQAAEQPAPEQQAAEQPAPEQPAPEQPAPSQPAPDVAVREADSAAQTAQDTQAVQDTQAAQSTQVAQHAVPSAQVAAAEPAAEAQAPEQPTVQAVPASSAAAAPQGETVLVANAEQPVVVLMPRGGEGQIRVLQQAESVSAGLGAGTLVLETVDYDARGRTRVGGRAEAGSRLVVYLDNKPAAHAAAAPSGRWEATLARSIAPGLHTLRVDQLANDGQVAARVETPFSRAAVLAALPSESAVIVQPGNSLWRISRRVYGEGVRYSVIYQANRDQIRDPDLIYPGQIFVVPTTN